MSAADVHPTAVVHPGARVARSVSIGPFAVVEDGVELGEGSILHAHAVIRSFAVLGRRSEVHPFAVIGGPPQDRRHDGSPARVAIGDDNVFREHVTVHGGTSHGGGVTRIGSGGMFMAGCHVAHDCAVGDGVTLANATLLGGHVELSDYVVTGGHVAIAPFVRVGTRTFIAGGAMVEADIPPYVVAAGDRARVRTLNVVGLRRAGVEAASRRALDRAFQCIFRSGEPRSIAAAALAGDDDPLVRTLVDFVRSPRAR